MMPSTKCPVCEKPGFNVSFEKIDIPHFGETLISVASCNICGYRHGDTLILAENTPVEFTIKIENEEDMSTKVIRSSSSTLEVPELGVKIEPGTHSEGYVTNIEGVLERIRQAILMGVRDADDAAHKTAEELIEKIEAIKNGREKATLHLFDPSGNSAIVPMY